MLFWAEVGVDPVKPINLFTDWLNSLTQSLPSRGRFSSVCFLMCISLILILIKDVLGDLGVRQAMKKIPKNTRL